MNLQQLIDVLRRHGLLVSAPDADPVIGGLTVDSRRVMPGGLFIAVPGSVAFAGEFMILAGVFAEGWAWAAVGAGAIVLAAMYMLRLISAVLHVRPGPAVADEALDLRPAELALVVPLVACLLALSAWPAAITERSFGSGTAVEASE